MPLKNHEFQEIQLNGNHTLRSSVNEILPPFSTFVFDLDKIPYNWKSKAIQLEALRDPKGTGC